MRTELMDGWRARRVVLAGGANGLCQWMSTCLTELGARAVRVSPQVDSQALCRALSAGRTSALIVPCMRTLSPGGLHEQLCALTTLLIEAREAGVPLVMLLCDEDVYLRGPSPYPACESDAIGGRTQQGLIQSMLQLYALGVARGLMGDAQGIVCVRHMPALGCGHPAVAQYGAWCDALLTGELLPLAHAASQGIFVHPLDVALGALCIGARHLNAPIPGAYNIGSDARSLMPNRSAALRLVTTHGHARPIREVASAPIVMPGALDGSLARSLLGIRTRIDAAQALSMLYDQFEAQSQGSLAACMAQQTREYLGALP